MTDRDWANALRPRERTAAAARRAENDIKPLVWDRAGLKREEEKLMKANQARARARRTQPLRGQDAGDAGQWHLYSREKHSKVARSGGLGSSGGASANVALPPLDSPVANETHSPRAHAFSRTNRFGTCGTRMATFERRPQAADTVYEGAVHHRTIGSEAAPVSDDACSAVFKSNLGRSTMQAMRHNQVSSPMYRREVLETPARLHVAQPVMQADLPRARQQMGFMTTQPRFRPLLRRKVNM